jgi:hypothetical protein
VEYLAYALAFTAIGVMGLNVYLATRLKRSIIGGEVGQKWSLLTLLISVFFVGYLLSPLALLFAVPGRYLNLLVFAVFLFGAVFVYVVIGIIREALTFLKLVK